MCIELQMFGFGIDKIWVRAFSTRPRTVARERERGGGGGGGGEGGKNANNIRNNAILMHYLMRCAFSFALNYSLDICFVSVCNRARCSCEKAGKFKATSQIIGLKRLSFWHTSYYKSVLPSYSTKREKKKRPIVT